MSATWAKAFSMWCPWYLISLKRIHQFQKIRFPTKENHHYFKEKKQSFKNNTPNVFITSRYLHTFTLNEGLLKSCFWLHTLTTPRLLWTFHLMITDATVGGKFLLTSDLFPRSSLGTNPRFSTWNFMGSTNRITGSPKMIWDCKSTFPAAKQLVLSILHFQWTR